MATPSLRDPKRRPTHPGALLREDVLPALKMTKRTLPIGSVCRGLASLDLSMKNVP